MEILEIFDTDLQRYEKRFMEAAKGREVVETDFGVANGIHWMRMWVEEERFKK